MLHIYISPTGRNYAVSYWRKIFHIRLPTERNYAVSYWRKVIWKRKQHKPSFRTFGQVNNKSVLKSWSLFRFKSFISKQC